MNWKSQACTCLLPILELSIAKLPDHWSISWKTCSQSAMAFIRVYPELFRTIAQWKGFVVLMREWGERKETNHLWAPLNYPPCSYILTKEHRCLWYYWLHVIELIWPLWMSAVLVQKPGSILGWASSLVRAEPELTGHQQESLVPTDCTWFLAAGNRQDCLNAAPIALLSQLWDVCILTVIIGHILFNDCSLLKKMGNAGTAGAQTAWLRGVVKPQNVAVWSLWLNTSLLYSLSS